MAQQRRKRYDQAFNANRELVDQALEKVRAALTLAREGHTVAAASDLTDVNRQLREKELDDDKELEARVMWPSTTIALVEALARIVTAVDQIEKRGEGAKRKRFSMEEGVQHHKKLMQLHARTDVQDPDLKNALQSGLLGGNELHRAKQTIEAEMLLLEDEAATEALRYHSDFVPGTGTQLQVQLYNVTSRLNAACDMCEWRTESAWREKLYGALEDIGTRFNK